MQSSTDFQNYQPSPACPPDFPRLRYPLFVLCLSIITAIMLPPLPHYIGATKSLAFGMIAAAMIIATIVAINFTILRARNRAPNPLELSAHMLLVLGALVTCILIHGLIANTLSPVNFHRLILSLIPLMFLISGGFAIASALRNATPTQLHNASWIVFWLFIAVIMLRALHLEPHGASFHAPTFPFSETSHFALAFGPFYLYRSITARAKHQVFWILFGLAVAVIIKSATFLVFAFGAALLCRKLLITAGSAALLLLAGAVTHLSYFTSRADISSHSSNLSALVYLQGWELLIRSLIITHGWGLGFQQLGTRNFHLGVSHLIEALNSGTSLNTKGGGFILSKIGSEFGIFGLAAVIWYGLICLKSIRSLRATRAYTEDTFARCIIVGFGIDIFVRGVGYFYGSPLLFIGAALSLSSGYGILRSSHSADQSCLIVLR